MGIAPEWLWPEYHRAEAELDPENIDVKKVIAAQYGEDALRRSWLAVCKELENSTQEMIDQGTNLIREFSYDEFFQMGDADKEEIKRRGCVVIRGTIPSETANGWFQDIKTYMKDNKGVITGK